MLQATNITKSYGTLPILKGVSLQIHKGEMVAIVGSSGAGKSTLLHILGSLDTPDAGTVTINGITLTPKVNLNQYRNLNMGFVFQFHHLLPEFTALENVCIPGWIANRQKKELTHAATALLQKLGLSNKLGNKPQQLSGGEQQRVAVARALINNPQIIFADEPTGNLDSKNATELHQLFKTLQAELNQTFLIVTHNEHLASTCNRVLHMADGLIIN